MLDLFETDWQDLWAGYQTSESVGVVYTRPEIVEFILDLAGYSGSERLATRCVLEPSCGHGAFVTAMVARLVQAELEHASPFSWDDPLLDDAIRAAEINPASLRRTLGKVLQQLSSYGCPEPRAATLVEKWFVNTDFLLHPWQRKFDLVVGNPPYVRIEDVPRAALAHYRSTYRTAVDRADLYVPFIERGLDLLSRNGVLAFITANRFAKNLYGRGIRELIARDYRVRFFLNLEHTQPFLSEVSAYPAILVVDRHHGRPTRAATLESIDPETLETVREQCLQRDWPDKPVSEFPQWYPRGEPWLTTCHREYGKLSALRASFPILEASASHTRVGIGVATGADRVFVRTRGDLNIEPDRQIPLVMARDIRNGDLSWSGHMLVNPFVEGTGSLVRLEEFPKLAAYLALHANLLKSRHVARQRPQAWYRTIDRVWPELQRVPKLLIPDIQNPRSTVVALDAGQYYPHHNLYWITSKTWDLRALKSILRSTFVLAQIRAHSVQMRGGSLRWQAQTLRRLRIPPHERIPRALMEELISVADTNDQSEIDDVVEAVITSLV